MNPDDIARAAKEVAGKAEILVNPDEARAGAEMLKAAAQNELAGTAGLWAGLMAASSPGWLALAAIAVVVAIGTGIYVASRTANPDRAIDPLSHETTIETPDSQRP